VDEGCDVVVVGADDGFVAAFDDGAAEFLQGFRRELFEGAFDDLDGFNSSQEPPF